MDKTKRGGKRQEQTGTGWLMYFNFPQPSDHTLFFFFTLRLYKISDLPFLASSMWDTHPRLGLPKVPVRVGVGLLPDLAKDVRQLEAWAGVPPRPRWARTEPNGQAGLNLPRRPRLLARPHQTVCTTGLKQAPAPCRPPAWWHCAPARTKRAVRSTQARLQP